VRAPAGLLLICRVQYRARAGLRGHAGEQAARERAPRQQPNAIVAGGAQHLQLDGPLDQVVDRLLRGQAEEVPGLRGLLGSGKVPASEVAAADIAHLAVTDTPRSAESRAKHFPIATFVRWAEQLPPGAHLIVSLGPAAQTGWRSGTCGRRQAEVATGAGYRDAAAGRSGDLHVFVVA